MSEHAPEKPARGEPCTGCGTCCRAEVCPLGQMAYGTAQPPPCPAMAFEAGRFWCRLVRLSEMVGGEGHRLLRNVLGVGAGCTCD